MKVETRAEIHVPQPPEQVFDFAVACDTFPRILHKLGPLPGIVNAEMVDAPAPRLGARRRVTMSDGNVVEEELVAFERPVRHRYRWLSRLAPPFSLLVRTGEGDWTFTPSGGGTTIVWIYRFDLTTPLVYPFAALVLVLFRRWMMRGLGLIRTELAT